MKQISRQEADKLVPPGNDTAIRITNCVAYWKCESLIEIYGEVPMSYFVETTWEIV